MKLLFDQNLSNRLVRLLAANFPGSAHVRDLGMAAADDQTIWDYARQHDFVIVSKDSDFQQRALLYSHPPKVIWLRIGNGPTSAVVTLITSRLADIATFDADPTASILILS